MKKTHIVVISALLLLMLFVLGSFLVKGKQQDSLSALARKNAEALVRDHSQTAGSPDAKVVIVEFMDPGCETCRAFDPFIKQMMAAYPGKIRLVIRYAPLHHGADFMCAVLEAARKQGKYWETLQLMYDTQPQWADHHNPQPDRIWQYLPRLGLDLKKLKKDLDDPAISRLIAQDMADARALDVRKTPGFFVNGKPLVRFGYEQLQALIEGELRANY
ncbi:MAG: DsbA family protein [Nitrospirota bacterium]|nr:DsbA family protein [Nitrospirota bacterium]